MTDLEVPNVWRVAAAAGALIDLWSAEYLRAVERQDPDLDTADPIPELGKTTIRHAGFVRRGEQLPAIVAWPEGVANLDFDPNGTMYGTVEVGVVVVVSANDEDATTRLAHHYVAAVRALMLHHPVTVTYPDGQAVGYRAQLTDEDYTAIDVLENGRVRAGVTLSYQLPGVYLGNRKGGPPPGSTPRDDPRTPWPAGPTVQTVDVDVVPTPNPLDLP